MHRLTAAALLLATAATAHADWTATNLHPTGATRSEIRGVENGVGVGYSTFNNVPHAGLWNGSADSWLDLRPANATSYSWAHSINGGVIAGDAVVNGVQQASMWNGTAESWTSLNPAGSPLSGINVTRDGQQGGFAVLGGIGRAVIWSGTAESHVDLHPLTGNIEESWVLGLHNNQQVGITIDGNTGLWNAAMWSGTAASYVNLNPAGAAESDAVAVYNGYQYGSSSIAGTWRASRWSGSADSRVDMHPGVASHSFIQAAHDGVQAGIANIGGQERASVWFDSADSWVDLHALLEGNWGHSRAYSVWTDGTMTYVGGYGHNLDSNQFEAVMWTIPAPGAAALFAMSALAATCRRRA